MNDGFGVGFTIGAMIGALVIGFFISIHNGKRIESYKQDAVKNNAAEFVVNPENGKPSIIWKETRAPAFGTVKE